MLWPYDELLYNPTVQVRKSTYPQLEDEEMATKPVIENALAQRYASVEMCELWSERGKIIAERQFWVAIMRGQQQAGLDISDAVIADYERVIDDVRLDRIAERERITRHDVKARIDEFDELAGAHGKLHLGLTSRDLTENIEQWQVRESLMIVMKKVIAALARLDTLAVEHGILVMAGRSHNVAGEPTTLGKRFATWAEELLVAQAVLEYVLKTLPLRGIKGPMGTSVGQVELLGREGYSTLENEIRERLGFVRVADSVGQVSPRSYEAEVVSALHQLACAPSNFATTLRLMAGHELVTEGFAKNQVGSSAMPHKMNARTSERICGFKAILSGHVTMINSIAGNQWNEGDVSCSVVRRVVLPDAFFVIDGLFECFLTVLDDFGVYPRMIEAELERYLPFLTTTAILRLAIDAGISREVAHEAIKECAVKVAQLVRDGEAKADDLYGMLAEHPDLERLPIQKVREEIANPLPFAGEAPHQVAAVSSRIRDVCLRYPDEYVSYTPGDIL